MNKIDIEDINFNLVKINCPADGHCYFHSILRSFCVGYINGNNITRYNYVKKFRKYLAELLKSDNTYELLSNGKLKEYSKEIADYSLKNMITELNSDDAVNNLYQELISNFLGIDIYIVDLIKNKIYLSACDTNILYKNRKSIILGYSYYSDFDTIGHYDIVGLNTNGKINTLFSNDHNLIKAIKSKII